MIRTESKIKVAVTNMRYFARSKFSRSLVHKRNFSLIQKVVFKLEYVFCQERQVTYFEFLNSEKSDK